MTDGTDIIEIDAPLQELIQDCNEEKLIHLWCQLLILYPTLAPYCTCWNEVVKSALWKTVHDTHPELYNYVLLTI